jgi:hypothetical protein
MRVAFLVVLMGCSPKASEGQVVHPRGRYLVEMAGRYEEVFTFEVEGLLCVSQAGGPSTTIAISCVRAEEK